MFEINDDLSGYSAEELADLIVAGNEALDELFNLDDPTDEQVTQAEGIVAAIASLEAEQAGREQARDTRTSKMAALKQQRLEASTQPDEPDEEEEQPEEEEEPQEAPPPQPAEQPQAVAASSKPSPRQALAKTVRRPTVPVRSEGRITITAAADVPEFPTGASLEGMTALGVAMINRMHGFPQTYGIEGAQMQNFAVASLRKGFPDELVIDKGKDDWDIVEYAAKESRLAGSSLTASGGWCAPSETLYDFCGGESTDGLIDLPEVAAKRGGVRSTPGPDFSTIYTNVGFCQTEAQAIAGTAKTCYEVTCPTFTDTRLDACGLCIKVPILTNAAYPELVQRTIALSLIAHQHKISAKLITGIVADAGAALVTAAMGATTTSTLDAVELVIATQRQNYRLGFTQTLEVIAPFWLKAAIRADLAARGGIDLLAVSDTQIESYFSVRGARVQWVYNWQPLAANEEGYPTTAQIVVYPAGTYVKATNDVINLSAVYDAASLTQNTYTGLFMEEGVALVKRCYASKLVTVAVCSGGVTGATNSTACFNLT